MVCGCGMCVWCVVCGCGMCVWYVCVVCVCVVGVCGVCVVGVCGVCVVCVCGMCGVCGMCVGALRVMFAYYYVCVHVHVWGFYNKKQLPCTCAREESEGAAWSACCK